MVLTLNGFAVLSKVATTKNNDQTSIFLFEVIALLVKRDIRIGRRDSVSKSERSTSDCVINRLDERRHDRADVDWRIQIAWQDAQRTPANNPNRSGLQLSCS
jgi:hypothetical protein